MQYEMSAVAEPRESHTLSTRTVDVLHKCQLIECTAQFSFTCSPVDGLVININANTHTIKREKNLFEHVHYID